MNPSRTVRSVLLRELKALQRELECYPEDEQIWQLPRGISNSGGTLALHLVGNLQAFVGAALGNSGYERDRDAEFSLRDVAKTEILVEIERTLQVVDSTLQELSDEEAEATFPGALGDLQVRTGEFLIHLATHLAFHLGQVDYHRRLVTGENRSIAPLSVAGLIEHPPTE